MKLIKIKEHYYLCNNDEVKLNDWTICNGKLTCAVNIGMVTYLKGEPKVMASTEESFSILEELPLIDINELNDHLNHYVSGIHDDAIEVLANNATDKVGYNEDEGGEYKAGWIDGYKSLRDDTNKKFTFEDIYKAMHEAMSWSLDMRDTDKRSVEQVKNDIVMSITNNTQTEWDIDVEKTLVEPDNYSMTKFEPFYAIKVNEDGYIKIIKLK